jgi:hypothetical protein
VKPPTTFEARYSGTCERCDEPIQPGDRIRPTGMGTYEHATCDVRPPATRFEGTSLDRMGY